jgi:hypothetical protein
VPAPLVSTNLCINEKVMGHSLWFGRLFTPWPRNTKSLREPILWVQETGILDLVSTVQKVSGRECRMLHKAGTSVACLEMDKCALR